MQGKLALQASKKLYILLIISLTNTLMLFRITFSILPPKVPPESLLVVSTSDLTSPEEESLSVRCIVQEPEPAPKPTKYLKALLPRHINLGIEH